MRNITLKSLFGICFMSVLACITGCSNNTRAKQELKTTTNKVSVRDTIKENRPISTGISQKESTDQEKSIKERTEDKKNNEKDPVVGMFKCKKTDDKYLFLADGTGCFFSGGTNTEFKWSRKDNIVTLIYEAFGKEYLLYDHKKKTLKEDSESYGILVFEKI